MRPYIGLDKQFTSDIAFERFHGLNQPDPEEQEYREDMETERKIDEALEREAEDRR
jgi:hypothetical protein